MKVLIVFGAVLVLAVASAVAAALFARKNPTLVNKSIATAEAVKTGAQSVVATATTPNKVLPIAPATK